MLIADEIQTGFVRTSKLFEMGHYDVAADLTILAKGLTGGFLLSAVVGCAKIVDAAVPGGLGGTFGGNPVSITAACAVLDVIAEEDLCERANMLGERLNQRLTILRTHMPQIAQVRGPGLMVVVEFNHADSSTPYPEFTNAVRVTSLERHLILLTCGVHGNVIRFLAPLTIQDAVFDEALDILETVLLETAQQRK